jgi:D-glycero-alpha-D-manno-heptose-7-phosphate kinase
MIITQTPLRISFAGGGTDFPEFFHEYGSEFLSTAIDKYVFVIIKERFDEQIVLNYSTRETVENVDDIRHDLIREAMRITGVERGVEISTLADIPSQGCGLGSSSSITVGLLNALYAYTGTLVTAEQLAREAVKVEVDVLQRPMGIQDQYIAAYGNMRHFRVALDGTVTPEPVRISESKKRRLSDCLMLYYLNVTRNSSTILGEQKENIPQRVKVLRQMSGQVAPLHESLLGGDLDAIGRVLHKGWELKRGLASNISNDTINQLYERAKSAGALGGKVAGAGGGGFLLIYCPLDHQDRLRAEMSDFRELPFQLEKDGSKTIFNVSRYSTK